MKTTSEQTKPESRSFFLTSLPFFIMAHAAHHFLTALPQPLLPAMRDEFKLSYTKASLIPMSFAISGATGQLPAGWMADRVGPTLLIAAGTIGVALAGVGIGLALCRTIAERMGGSIFLEDTGGVGTSFGLTLPLQMVHEDEDNGLQ